ncbi:MAG: arginine--tRNA ligase, partial [Candidatus Bathyarchaeia archaeon]
WIGQLYTTINCILQINSLKKKLEEKQSLDAEERLKRELDEYVAFAAELNEQHPTVFSKLLQGTQSDVDPESHAENIVRSYEAGETATVRLVRRLVRKCLQGFRRTLRLAGVEFDSWDWESDLVWDGTVASAVEGLTKTDFVTTEQGALALNVDRAADTFNLKARLGYDAGYEISPLVLRRKDGTTLYTTRDIAYHIKKLKTAERVVNVIGVDQKLAQQQLKVALYLLGYSSVLDNLTHYAYEMVHLPGYKMSRRRGRYVTFDEIMDQAISMAYAELEKRSPQMAAGMKRRISRTVGIGAVKHAMLNVSSTKAVTFTWDRVLNFETNSGPFIQYAHARACSVIRKARSKPRQPDFTLMTHPLERKVMLMVARFPEVFREAADDLKPELLLEFANALADAFNAFYNELPILRAEKTPLRDSRLCLVHDTRAALHNSLELVGINAPSRM